MSTCCHFSRSGPLNKLPLPGAFLSLWLLTGCSGTSSALAPASNNSQSIANLFWFVFAIALVIFLLVEAWLIFTVVRFRAKPGGTDPPPVFGHARLEMLWTIVPALILVVVFIATVSTMTATTRPKPDELRVKVVGHQWWWEVQYPDLGITTATDIHLPVGQPVAIELTSADVIHSFWAPEMAGKTDVIPGKTNWSRFTPGSAGAFRGMCAEFCGAQHANMGFQVIAESPTDFADWARKEAEPAPVAEESWQEGEAGVFLQSACVGCHTISGSRANGIVGPNLTHFGSRQTIAALTLLNKPENLAAWLSNPQKVKPGTKMPNLGLSQGTIDQLVNFLESLK